jgi:chromosome partitioning protein
MRKRRVLLVDLDPQSHATAALTDPESMRGPGTAEVLTGRATVEGAAGRVADGVDLLGSSPGLDPLEGERAGPVALGRALRAGAASYDLAIIDCPPNTGPLTRAALAAADYVLVPVETSYFALYGVGRMLRLIDEEGSRRGRPLPYGVLLTMFDRRTAHAREVLRQSREYFGRRLFSSVIGVNVSLREAASHGRPITEYRSRSSGFRHYMELSGELLAVLAEAPGGEAGRAAGAGGKAWTS